MGAFLLENHVEKEYYMCSNERKIVAWIIDVDC